MDKKSVAMRRSNIMEQFRGAHVLVTGGTGFMGQVLMEKLLRTCQIEKLYIIVRPKKGMTESERIEKIFGGPLYERVNHEQPHCMRKVVLVAGDFEKQGLGLSEVDRAVLVREVNIIFHCAATVRFDEKLWTAISINILGTKYMVDLAREMPHLKAFVHFSTAYSYCTLKEIGERFYTPPMIWTELVQLVNSLDQETVDMITPIVIGGWPNTYSFTKAVAEDMIKEETKGLPVGILRPSIVFNTAYEPVVGWANNFYGPMGISAGAGTGILKTLHCKGDIRADMVPVDMAINSAIAVAWDLAQHMAETKLVVQLNTDTVTPRKCGDGVNIFNYVSSVQNPITWGEFKTFSESAAHYPSFHHQWHYSLSFNKHRLIHKFYAIFLHLLPAIFVDIGAMIIGKQLRMLKLYQKIHKFTDVLAYFTTQQWTFSNDNVQNLWKNMSPEDKHLFKFDITLIEWEEIIFRGSKGLKLYILNEPILLEKAAARYRRLKYLHYTVVYLFRLLVLYVAYRLALHYWIICKDTILEILQ